MEIRTGDYPLHGGNLEWAAERYGLEPDSFLDFSANVNPLGAPPCALQAARKALDNISRYPEPDSGSLKYAMSRFFGLESNSIMVGNGSTELIHHFCRSLNPKRVTLVMPGFAEYERAARNSQAAISHYRLSWEEAFSIDPQRLAEAAATSDLVFVCNPASPSGRLYQREDMLPALQACRETGGLLVVDESFMGFCRPEDVSSASLIPEAKGGGLVIITTLTKLFALAGLRGPGCLISTEGHISRWEGAGYPWRVNSPAAAAGMAALTDGEYLSRTRALVAEWRKGLYEGLHATGRIEVFPSRVNFLLLRVLDGRATSLCDELGRKGILIRDCSNFAGLDDRYARVCVQRPEINNRLVEAIGEVWAG
ncbi:MAG: threonine-phosphate decarboxylase [Candidatus Solincola sediminis]|uniref:threonine-phosphate decarboxylase n=1 Tax=Candidatus Solincola sediminis TaxID=1797199 RepID=A0A1F2WQB3_9ACTN|nr:MAG: threonine-phosphate decarboxylase [Candidatus Solincola sediminis]OFW61495.1 MAG: threonine-phosphate decarboxylase [Candidatus Solincola sediminis]